MCRPTIRALEQVALETPFGVVRLLFQSLQRCVVLLPDQYTEPPTAYVVIDEVAVEGRLVFDHFGYVWYLDQDPEHSRCYNVATDCQVSRELRDKLAKKLAVCLRRWVKANPDAMQAIDRALQRQAIEKLEGEIGQLNALISRFVAQREAKQSVIHRLQERLREETGT